MSQVLITHIWLKCLKKNHEKIQKLSIIGSSLYTYIHRLVATFLQKLVKFWTKWKQLFTKKYVTFQKLKLILLIIFDFYFSILDRFLSAQPIDKDIFQLSGCAAFLLAAKHEERDPPKITELVNLCAHCYMKVSYF